MSLMPPPPNRRRNPLPGWIMPDQNKGWKITSTARALMSENYVGIKVQQTRHGWKLFRTSGGYTNSAVLK